MSDEFFTSYDIRGKIDSSASLEVAWNIGKALADWLPTTGDVAVLRGEDAAERLVEAVIEGLRLQGRTAVDAGNGDRSALTELVTMAGYSGGVLVGHDTLTGEVTIELYRDGGKLIDSETGLTEIAELVKAGNFVPSAIKGELKKV